MSQRHYHLVDVFTDQPFGGNPLAVFPDGRGLTTAQMQTIARELNLSESTFILPPEDAQNHFKLRIFTPTKELPMAGHPTVGTSFVLVREKLFPAQTGANTLRLEEGVGLIPVTFDYDGSKPGRITMQQMPPTYGEIFEDRETFAAMLGLTTDDLVENLPVQVVSCGKEFVMIALKSIDAIRRIELHTDIIHKRLGGSIFDELMVFTMETETPDGTVHARMFAPELGITEDPATGAASGPLGCYLVRYGLVSGTPAKILSEQGFEMGRPSYIHIGIEGTPENITRVTVGGESVYMGGGWLEIEDGQ